MPNCPLARAVCVGLAVRACADNQMGEVLEDCTEACSFGRCTSNACLRAEGSDPIRGCRFYGAQVDSIDSEDEQNLMVILTNAADTPAKVSVEINDLGGVWRTLEASVIPPRAGTRIEIKRPVKDPGVTVGGAYRVNSDVPLLAVEIVGDDTNRTSRSSAGTVLRPIQSLGSHYIAVTSPARDTADVARINGSRAGAGAITVIATAGATRVSLGLTTAALVAPGVVLDPPPAEYNVPIPMEDGDVLQIFSSNPDGDLTGTTIEADGPVAVFSGNIYTTYGFMLTGSNGGDLAMEQLPPTASWGLGYVGARLSPSPDCEPFFGTNVGRWSIIAGEHDTSVTLYPAPGVSIDGPNLPVGGKLLLGRGESQTFFASGQPAAAPAADFFAEATQPILLAQWLDCEPGLSWGIDTRLSGTDLAFTLPPGFAHEMVLVRKKGVAVTLDDRLISESSFRTATATGEFEVARLVDLIRCPATQDGCDHRISGASFGVSWRGTDIVCSYSVTVPTESTCALPGANCPQ